MTTDTIQTISIIFIGIATIINSIAFGRWNK